MPFWTEDWMGSLARAPSPAMRAVDGGGEGWRRRDGGCLAAGDDDDDGESQGWQHNSRSAVGDGLLGWCTWGSLFVDLSCCD